MHRLISSCLQLSDPSSHSLYSESCGEAVALKQLAFSSWKAKSTEGNFRSFHKARNKCVATLKRTRKQRLSNLKNELSKLSPSYKTLWCLVKSVSCVCSPSLTSNGTTANSAREKAECLKSVFGGHIWRPNLTRFYSQLMSSYSPIQCVGS